jgi:hypothetical protein
MVLLGDEALVDAQYDLFRDRAHLNARLLLDLRRSYHKLKNYFGCTRWNSKVT